MERVVNMRKNELLLCISLILIYGFLLKAEEEKAVDSVRIMAGKAGYDFLIGDVDAYAVARYTADGKRVWEYTEVRAIDAWAMKDGNVLVAFLPSDRTAKKSGIRLVSPGKKTLFEYLAPEGEVMSCCPLANGNILVAETHMGRVVEVDRTGKVVSSFDVKAKGMGHKAIRMVRLTPEGTVLVAECYSNFLREYSREGKCLREFPVKMAYCAQRLANGNTLISGYNPAVVVEMTGEGSVVWKIEASDLPADAGVANFCEIHRLENGNTLVSNCIRRSVKNKVVLFEITLDKKIVWQLRDSEAAKGVTSVKPVQ